MRTPAALCSLTTALCRLYIAVHKPLDYVCSLAREAANNKIIYDLLPVRLALLALPQFRVGDVLKTDTNARRRRPSRQVRVWTGDYESGWCVPACALSPEPRAGQFVNRILSPNGHAERVYEIEVEKPLRGDEPEHFASGLVELRGERTPLRPARMEITDPNHCRYALP